MPCAHATELPVHCPDPLERAPRGCGPAGRPHERLQASPRLLEGAISAVLYRDIRGLDWDDAQRLSHFPASPLVSLSWFQDFDVGLVERTAEGPAWRPFGSAVVVSGSLSRPTVSWAPRGGRGCMAIFTADVAQGLFGLDLAAIHDRFVAAHEVLDARWWPMLDALLATEDDDATLATLQQHILPRWRALAGHPASPQALARLGRHWLDRLAWQAWEWQRTRSPRQVERRIKAHSGRSMREWRSLVQTEGVFFSARARHEAGLPIDWAGLAQDEGFADQSHLIRAVRRITGFSPGEFAERYEQDESFWMYRLWA